MEPFSSTDDISLSSLKSDWQTSTLTSLKKDLWAGLNVALLTVPQAMAYSLVAGLPVSCGLIAAVFSAIVAAFLGSSKYLIVGPVNAVAILLQAGTSDILYSHYWEASPLEKETLAIDIMTQIAFLSGMFHLGIAVFKLGRLTQFVSHSVVIGYLAGGAFAIIVNQLFTFTGINPLGGVNSLFEKTSYFFSSLSHTDLSTLSIGLFSLLVFVLLKKWSPRIPSAALMLIGATLVCYLISLTPYNFYFRNVSFIGETSEPFSILPLFSLPALNPSLMNHMLSVAFAVALLSIIETTCTAKSIASASGQGISINQEILAVGAANIISSCTGSMPVSVSNSRSQLNVLSGAKTRFAAIFNGLFVALIIGYFDHFVHMIPLAAMASLLFVTAFTLVNPKQLLLCWKSTSSDAFVMISTFLACIFFSLDTAF